MSIHPKALVYRASHRGTKENDIILGPYAEAMVSHMGDDERIVFADFLESADEDIYYWVRDLQAPPTEFYKLVEDIKAFTHKKN